MNIFLHNAFSCLINLLTFTIFHLGVKGPHGDKGSQGEKGIPGACDAKVWRWSYTSCNNALTCSAHTKYVIFSRLKIFRETLLFEGFFLLKSNKVIDS